MSFPDVQGLSVVFRERASLYELARAAQLPYPNLSYSVVSLLRAELRAVGFEMVLYITPSRRLPAHHTLAVAAGGITLPNLPDAAADALIRTLIVDRGRQSISAALAGRHSETATIGAHA
jgi:hypothetical protein